MSESAGNPSSTGPAGPHFEGQVGAYYLLALLMGAEPRGLPGTRVVRVEMQRAGQGRSLDDVVVHAESADGSPAVLEIQVKREISFSPKDATFEKVTRQIAGTFARSDFTTTRYELGIATAKISRKIAGSYQDLLAWARSMGSASVLLDQVQRERSGNNDKRLFVETLRHNLGAAGVPSDDQTLWQILRRLQILVFDFTALGSANEELVLERIRQGLHPEGIHRARDLWTTLVERALYLASNAGSATREELIEMLAPFQYPLTGERRFVAARKKLAEDASLALADMDDRVSDITLRRSQLLDQLHTARDTSRYIEIKGSGGVGKSALLKHCARQASLESQIVVCCPGRITPGGLTAWSAQFQVPGSGREFLTDLAAGGASALFVDGLEGFSPAERPTVIDLVRVAAELPEVAVIVTARQEFGVDEPSWLPKEALVRLGAPVTISVQDLTDDEIEELQQATPQRVFPASVCEFSCC